MINDIKPFKVGDLVQHRASGEKAVVTGSHQDATTRSFEYELSARLMDEDNYFLETPPRFPHILLTRAEK